MTLFYFKRMHVKLSSLKERQELMTKSSAMSRSMLNLHVVEQQLKLEPLDLSLLMEQLEEQLLLHLMNARLDVIN
jgi:hypothetical protein